MVIFEESCILDPGGSQLTQEDTLVRHLTKELAKKRSDRSFSKPV
jgi:hypothetical protein